MDVQIRNLTKTFGSLRANDAISLSFAAGNIHGILGENGAGKSTLMKLLAGFLQRDSGEVLLDGQPARLHTPAAALAAGVGMVHQDPMDIPAFSALENFFCASPRRALPSLAVARQRLIQLNQQLGFTVAPDQPLARLTVGQRQQLEIMRLLACGVKVLILDEPTTGITAAQKTALFAALRRLTAQGKTVLFVSHKLDEVAELCQTVSILRNGRVVGPQLAMPQPQAELIKLMFGQEGAPAPPRPTTAPPTPASATPVWQLNQITVREGALTVSNLTLSLPRGCVVGLCGLDGSGQQVLLRLLAGRLRPERGQLLLHGVDVTRAPYRAFRAAGIEYLPADRMHDGVIGALTLTEHLLLTRKPHGLIINRADARTQAETAIAAYNIKATPDTPLASLSGGNQQRAMLALLSAECTGLLFDQPTRGLDVVSARAIWQRLLHRRTEGTAIVFASADFDELLDYSDLLLVFFGGQVSHLLPCATMTATRLAELIGGVGFAEVAARDG